MCGVNLEAKQKTLLSKLVGLDLRANHSQLRRGTGQTGYVYKRLVMFTNDWYESRRFRGCVRDPIVQNHFMFLRKSQTFSVLQGTQSCKV